MSLKKLALLSALSVAAFGATSALAGNANVNNNVADASALYVEGGMGFAARSWQNQTSGAANPFSTGTISRNAHGGFTALVDAGYQFNNLFSTELGVIYLPQTKGTIDSVSVDDKVKSYTTYLAGKAQVPVYEKTYVFSKLGVAYSKNKWKAANASNNANYFSPLFAAGVQYYINSNVSVTGQYTYVPGFSQATTSSSQDFDVPAAQLFTVGMGYKFSV